MTTNNSKYYIQSVDSAAKILFYLSRFKTKDSTLTEISQDLNVNKTTTLRILTTLKWHNLVYYNKETRKYSLGIQTSVLGNRVFETLDYLKVIKKFMKEATNRTSLTTALIQKTTSDRAMFVAQEETSNYPKLTISVGNKFPLTEVSFGKWFLAYMDEQEREIQLKKGLKKKTDNTITDVNKYKEELVKMHNMNVIISREEYTKGVIAMSSPLFNKEQEVIGVLAAIGISKNISDQKEIEISKIIKDIANECNIEMRNDINL